MASSAARLSAAMIVRDEAGQLPGCLESLLPLVDEVVVVDTGSRDNTVEIAERAGCVVRHFAWCDDFSAARNVSLEACTGDWIFIVDADERVDPFDFGRFRALLTDRGAAYRFTTRNYTDATHLADFVPAAPEDPLAHGHAGWFPSTKVRLFPALPGVRFEGTVHELVNGSLASLGVRLESCGIPIHHYPLERDPQSLARKRALYLALGEAKAQCQPDDANAQAELGHQQIECGDVAGALASYRRAVKLAPRNAEYLRDLGAALYLAGRPEEAERAAQLALALDPALISAWRNLGIALLSRGAHPQAATAFEAGLALAPDDPGLREGLALARNPPGAQA